MNLGKCAHSRLFTTVLCITLSACDDLEREPTDLRNGGIDCPRWQCGYNTSEVNGKSLGELHLGGLPNHDGISIHSFVPPHNESPNWRLDVDGDELVARGGPNGNSTLRGHQLVGATIWLNIDESALIPIVISAYEEVTSWASNGKPIAAYAIRYDDANNPDVLRSVCQGTLADPSQPAVVILADERYDADTKTVIPKQKGWVTLACAGSAAAKLALLGYGPHAKFTDDSEPASVAQRQATLKMITADYCGTGHAYTHPGMPLWWENQSGTVIPNTEPGTLEAIWNERGAVCLDDPRVVELEEVQCAIPRCDEFTLDNGEWVTYNVEGE